MKRGTFRIINEQNWLRITRAQIVRKNFFMFVFLAIKPNLSFGLSTSQSKSIFNSTWTQPAHVEW